MTIDYTKASLADRLGVLYPELKDPDKWIGVSVTYDDSGNEILYDWKHPTLAKPTDSQLASVDVTDIENKRKEIAHVSKRQEEYPSIEDQLDMQYWDKKNGTTTWVDAIAKVKSDNPKL